MNDALSLDQGRVAESFRGRLHRQPLVLAGLYALAGGAWIALSDGALGALVRDPAVLMRLSVYKGFAFVAATTVLLYLLLRHGVNRLERDLVVREEAEALAEREWRFARSLVEAMPGVFYFYDQEGRFLRWNRDFERVTGHSPEEVARMHPLDFFGPDEKGLLRERIARVFERGEANVEASLLAKDGGRVPYYFTGRRITFDGRPCLLGVGLDISERKRAEAEYRQLEQQLRQSQKMEAIGRLAGGVAHDFNNLLSVILGYTHLALNELPASGRLRGEIDEVRLAGERAAELTKQLLTFSRQQVLQPQVVDLSQVVLGTEKMLRRLLGEDVVLELRCPLPGGRVHADPSQLEQILMNLAVNARDAMAQGGRLTLETDVVRLEASDLAGALARRPGHYVLLRVTDTGVGMDAATRERIFEPFFTTKEKGKGTGLGLATVFGIVQQSGGHIDVQTEPGRGTRFTVYLPSTDDALSGAQPPAAVPASLGGSETILVVEDDDQVRDTARAILERHGYRVLEAQNGGEAFLVSERHPTSIDLLLTDVVMPRMSGRELAERLLQARPELKVLYLSGYTEDARTHHGVADGSAPFLQKPLTPHTLLCKVREVLEARGDAEA